MRYYLNSLIRIALAVWLAGPALAWAASDSPARQTPPDRPTPPTTHIEERVPRAPAEPAAPLPAVSPPAVSPAAPPSTGTMVVTAVSVEGSTVYTPAELAPFHEDLLARAVSLDDIRRVADRITEKYRADGYFLSQAFVPPQGARLGVLRIQVVEGYFDDIAFTGVEAPEGVVSTLAADLVGDRPARLPKLERALLLMGDTYGYQVRDVAVEPLDREAVRYRLKVDLSHDRTLHSVILDNRGTEESGPLQLWASAGVNDVLLTDSRLQVGVFTVPNQPKELKYGELQGSKILGAGGTAATLLVSTSTSDSGGDDAAFGIESGSSRVSARLSHPFLRSRDLSLWVSGTVDVAEYDKEAAGTPIYDDELRVGRLGANLYGADRFEGTNRLSVELSHGFDAFGASSVGDQRSRYGASAAFTKLRVDASRDQALGGNFWLEGKVAGQVSADQLLSSEEFSLGGSYIGRAYDYSELTGEHGVGGSLELRYGRDLDGPVLNGFQAYGFYDFGAVWNLGQFEENRATLSSAGVGVRLVFDHQLRLNLEYARGLTRAVNDEGDKVQRVFFKLSQGF